MRLRLLSFLMAILAITATSCIGPIADMPPGPGGCPGHHGGPPITNGPNVGGPLTVSVP